MIEKALRISKQGELFYRALKIWSILLMKYGQLFLNSSLYRIGNLTSVSIVCKAALKSLFCAPNGLNELPEVCFEFPFILIGKWTKTFLTGQSWHGIKSRYTVGDPEQGFRRRFADGLN